MSAWRRFCARRDRYAHSLIWLACACERRPALSFVGVGRRFCFCARLCACVGACCVLVTRWARRSCGDCRALGGRVCVTCGARVLTSGVSRVGAWWLSCCRRVVRDGGFVGWLRFCATVVIV